MTEPRYYACKIHRVVDGDTFEVTIDLGFEVFVRQTVRLYGVDTPEMGTTEGRAAKTAVAQWFGDPGQVHRLVSYSAKDKYGRRICDVQHGVNIDLQTGSGELLSEWLLLNGLARPYPRAATKARIDDPWQRHDP